ncbi:helix-turn-helix domain-containing protein [Pseudoalteromonas sp. YIC-656]|uniref:helix-turn-helix domain-containing protein n=1 Tax=Pseudoalteromonas pernae TaxID=3118054 RepID=UPI0032428363
MTLLPSEMYASKLQPIDHFGLSTRTLDDKSISEIWCSKVSKDNLWSEQLLHADGRMGLFVVRGPHVYINDCLLTEGVYVCGANEQAQIIRCSADAHMFGARFHIGQQQALINLPAHELTGQMLAIGDLPRTAFLPLLHPNMSFTQFTEQLLKSSSENATPHLKLSARLINECGNSSVVADTIKMSKRSVERHALNQIGLPLKTIDILKKVARARATIKTNPNTSLTQIAHDIGFADQAHFTRQFKHVVGMTPRQYKTLKSKQINR